MNGDNLIALEFDVQGIVFFRFGSVDDRFAIFIANDRKAALECFFIAVRV